MNLSFDDVRKCITFIDNVIAWLRSRRDILFNSGKITPMEYISIGSIITELIDIRSDITLRNVAGILISVNDSMANIENAINVINDRIQTLNDINNTVALFANVINLFSGILGGVINRTIPDLAGLIAPFLAPPS